MFVLDKINQKKKLMSHHFASINFGFFTSNIVSNFVSDLYEARIRSSVRNMGLNDRLSERIALAIYYPVNRPIYSAKYRLIIGEISVKCR